MAILLAIIGCYVWLVTPDLTYYSPQLAGVLALSYFGLRFARKKRVLPLSQAHSSPEFACVSAAILLLIGSTGNLSSVFFPFAYIHLFFLTMSLRPFQAILVSVSVVFFHFALSPSASFANLSPLLSLLLMLLVFLFTKKQYEEYRKEHQVVEKQEEEISDQKSNAILFITTFLKPKMENLLKLSDYPEENKQVIARQILIIQDEVERLLEDVNK